jgi:DNA-binding NtrC family response regulator/tetratricopeptide (TPR) repeat protein
MLPTGELSHMHLKSSTANLVRAGRFREALEEARREGATSVEHRLLVAELLQLTGRSAEAKVRIPPLLAELSRHPAKVARCLEVLGAIHVDEGDVASAVDCWTRSLDLARDAGHLEQVCRSQLRLLPTLAEQGDASRFHHVSADVRRNVLRAGDRHLTALLHLRFVQIEGKRGLMDRATRHRCCAFALLEDEPNVWIDGLISLDASTVSAIAGDIDEALALARRALDTSRQSGHLRTQVGALANLGALSLQTGQLDLAREMLREGLDRAAGFQSVRIALLDTYAQLCLLTGDVPRCEQVLAEVGGLLAAKTDARSSWLQLASQSTRIRLLFKRERWQDAASIAAVAARKAEERSDGYLSATFRLLQAEALATAGFADGAAAALNRACRSMTVTSPELLIERERVRAKVHFALGEGSRAADHFACALRLLSTRRNAWTFAAAMDDRALYSDPGPAETPSLHPMTVIPADERAESGTRAPRQAAGQDSRPADVPVDVVERLFATASRSDLLAREAFEAFRALDCAVEISLTATTAGGTPESLLHHGISNRASRAPAVVCSLGGTGHRTLELVVVPRASGLHEASALALSRVVQAAVELETLRRREKERTSLWPIDVDLETGVGIFASTAMHRLLGTVERVAATDVPVLITGETGVGKELVAREVHRRSDRAGASFLPFNCAAVPREMLESQLFGYRRGAFTGASEDFAGVIRTAAGGTLFLDEIGELGADVQPKLLRFLESGEIHPLGEARPLHVNVRVVAATNVDLEGLVRDGRFRADLYYRLNVVPLHVPPLRERREEIPVLVEHFLDRFAREMRKQRMCLTDEALEYLLLYRWPGNIRQLANEIRRAAAIALPAADLVPELLSAEIRAARRTIEAPPSDSGTAACVVRLDQPLGEAVSALERAMVLHALGEVDGRMEPAAGRLGISRKGLFLKRRRLGC